MSRDNGSIVGVDNIPTATTASGVWSLNAVALAVKNSIWPPAIPGVSFIEATGGTVTDYNGFRIHRFNSSDDFVITSVPPGATFELFMIGGGGGGGSGSSSGPGGGAGGAYYRLDYPCPAAGTYPMVIGAGGAGVTGVGDGNIGGETTGFGLTLVGGGTQNNQSTWTQPGGNQGSWGSGRTLIDGGCGAAVANGVSIANHPKWGDSVNRGRTVYDDTGGFSGANQTYYNGYAGGLSQNITGGGGGGIGDVGAAGNGSSVGGNGGAGLSFNWTGSTEWFGGGGGGGTGSGGTGGTGGSGVGGNGAAGSGTGGSGTTNTGSGAGGSGSGAGGTGGSGVIIIKYAIA